MEASQPQNMFSTPPPEPTLMQQFQKDNYDSMLKLKNDIIDMNNKTISDLNLKVFQLNNTIAELKSGIYQYHKPCEDKFNDVDNQLYDMEIENKNLKKELVESKSKEKQLLKYQQNKTRGPEKMHDVLEHENKKLKKDIEKLKSANDTKMNSIKQLEKEIEDIKNNANKVKTLEEVERQLLSESKLLIECDFCQNF